MPEEYVLGNPLMSFRQAKTFILKHAYKHPLPKGRTKRNILKAIEARLSYAEKTGQLEVVVSTESERNYEVTNFFNWARQKRGWGLLNELKGFSFLEFTPVTGVYASVQCGSVGVVIIPGTIAELQEELLACSKDRFHLIQENQHLSAEVTRLTTTLGKFSEAGKTGGAGKSKKMTRK